MLRRRRAVLAGGALVVAAVVGVAQLGGGATRSSVRSVADGTGAASGGDGPVALDPAEFAAGACVALAPTAGDRHLTVFLDAGHGGPDPGAVGATEAGATVTEAVENLPIELDATALLRADGYRVVVSRTADTSVVRLDGADVDGGELTVTGVHADVAARAECADDARASVLVGIYLDSGGSGAAGCVSAYDTARPFAAANERLAEVVQSDVLSAMDRRGWDIPDEGAISDAALGSAVAEEGSTLAAASESYDHLLELGPPQAGYLTTPSTMPGTVVEPLFLTDPFEATIAASRTGQRAIAGGLAEAIETFLAPSPLRTTKTSRRAATVAGPTTAP